MKQEPILTTPSYQDDPAEYERILRHNLSGSWHTKETLINCAVQCAIVRERLAIDLDRAEKKYFHETAGLGFLGQVFSMHEKNDLTQLAEIVEQHFGNSNLALLLRRAHTAIKKQQGSSGGGKKSSNDSDGKQSEKAFVKECWKAWQDEPSQYTSKAAFARKMLIECVLLTSPKVIEDWCRKWQEEK
ncbi:MAG: hypothetical protein JWL97_4348 [Gemmatimonadales bacterium]|nr:hypothetical protein [Gemmatimonadales bacterium]